jgi:hypothetical protein
MYPRSTKKTSVEMRRRRVAHWRLRHLTQREIASQLAQTDTPASLATVNRDVRHLEAEWRFQAAQDLAQLKANHLAELKEVRRVAWQGDNGPKLLYVLKSLEQEARVAGLEEIGSQDVDRATENFRLGAQAMRQLWEDKKRHAQGE